MKIPVLLSFSLFLLSRAAQATLVLPDALQEQLHLAVLEADIAVEDIESFADSQFHAKSHATARVLQVYRLRDDGGWFPREGETFTIESLGGEIGETGVAFSNSPRPYKGHKYRASVRRLSDQLFAVTGLSAGLVPHQKQRGYSRNRTDGSNGSGSGAFLYWDKAYLPIPYFISLPTFVNLQNFVEAIDAGFRPWRDPGNSLLEFLPMGCTTASSNRNDGVNTVTLITSDWAYDPTAIAITRNFYISGTSPRAGMILDTDILINAVNFTFSTSGAAGRHDIRNIVTHEVGHFIGLGHETATVDADATMYALAALGETKKRDLAANDIQGLLAGYGGVGQKFSQYLSTSGCSFARQPLSCASVHLRSSPGLSYLWAIGFIALAVLVGKFFLRASRQPTT